MLQDEVKEVKEPGFYAIIPATVRYDKELNSLDKLLYGELTALSFKEGYAFCSNEYLSKVYDVSPSTIKRALNRLESRKHIDRKVTSSNDGSVRKIYINKYI